MDSDDLTQAKPQHFCWLWEKRLPLPGITLLDGDHGCGKSILALQIAACVSSGTPLPDGTPTMQGGVVIAAPYNPQTVQVSRLVSWGADLSCIIGTPSIHDLEFSSHSFYLPENLSHLFDAVERVNARLIVLDNFTGLLSHKKRWTQARLLQLLDDLNQQLIARNVACLLIRDCSAKGGHARPSTLERSEHFEGIAASHLLLAHDPIQRDRLFLSHVRSDQATRTLILQIQRLPTNPDCPHIVVLGSHSVQAKDFMESSPDTLLRFLLSQYFLSTITDAPGPIHISTLCRPLKYIGSEKILRSLNDLLGMGQIKRPARGWYSSAITILDLATATTSPPQLASTLDVPAAATSTQTTLKTTEAYEEETDADR